MCKYCDEARQRRDDLAEEVGREMARQKREAGGRDAPAEKWLVTWISKRGEEGMASWGLGAESRAVAQAETLILDGCRSVQVSRVVYETREVTKRELVKVEGEVKP